MKDPDRTRTCAHGHPTVTISDEERGPDWVRAVLFGGDCPVCPEGRQVGLSYKPGTPPPPPPPQQPGQRRSIEDIAADVESRAYAESGVSPLPETCLECGGILGPNSKTVLVAGGGRRHVTGSLACRASSRRISRPAEASAAVEQPVTPKKGAEAPEPHNCPTCGRPVVEGAPYDLPALREALVNALKAADELIAGAEREQAALEELEP